MGNRNADKNAHNSLWNKKRNEKAWKGLTRAERKREQKS